MLVKNSSITLLNTAERDGKEKSEGGWIDVAPKLLSKINRVQND